MRAFIFDTETTGLTENRTLKLDRQPEIVEFYGVLVNLKTGKIGREVHHLLRTHKPIPEGASKVHGIMDEDVRDCPTFEKIAPAIYVALEEAPLVIAHNLSFDKEMVDIEMQRIGRKLVWPQGKCTVEQTIHLKGFRLSLGPNKRTNDPGLYHYLFNEHFTEAHRANKDTQALIRICIELFKRGLL